MRLPVGQSDFKKIIDSDFDFVDKSLMIKDIIDDDEVILITRPRRFGKTLNLSMLRYFFAASINNQSHQRLFSNLAINQADKKYLCHQSQYPVIFFSFKDIKEKVFSKAYDAIYNVIREMYNNHSYLLSSDTLQEREKLSFMSILDKNAEDICIKNSLKNLIKYLYDHHQSQVIVLVDEYDTPIQSGYLHDYYEESIEFFHGFFGAALKDNPYLFKSVLTGILRISKESLFSGLNNVVTYSLLNINYSRYFGFTEKEVAQLLEQAKLENQLENVKTWYNGYCAGNTVLYNPWSIASYLKERLLKPYWVNTSDNELIKKLLIQSSVRFKAQCEDLLGDKAIEKVIDDNVVFSDLKGNESMIWSLLLMMGYLKSINTEHTMQGTLCRLKIPNQEIRNFYRQITEQWLSDGE